MLLALRGIDEKTGPLELNSREECGEALGKLKALLRIVEDRKLVLDAETGSMDSMVTTRWIRQEKSYSGIQGTVCRKGRFEVGPGRAEVTLKLTENFSEDNEFGATLEMLAGSDEKVLWSIGVYSSEMGDGGVSEEGRQLLELATELLEASGVKSWVVEPEEDEKEEEEEEEEEREGGSDEQGGKEGGKEQQQAAGGGGTGGKQGGEQGQGGGEPSGKPPRTQSFVWPAPDQRLWTKVNAVSSFVSELTRVTLGRLAAPHAEEAARSGAAVEPGEGLVRRCLGRENLNTNAAALGRWLLEGSDWRLGYD